MKILIIGHSHIHALQLAYESDQIDWPKDFSVKFLPLRSKDNFSIFLYKNRDDHAEKTSKLVEKIEKVDAVLISFYGTIYHIIGLANDPVPFDFISISTDTERHDNGITYIPKTLMDVQMKNYTFKLKDHIETLISLVPDETPIYYLGSPPPVGSEKRIRSYPGNYQKKFDAHGISPPEFRHKLWQLHEKTVKSYCADADIEFLPAPDGTQDNAGMLKDEYCAHDPIHTNAAYGQLVLEDVIGKLQKRGPQNER